MALTLSKKLPGKQGARRPGRRGRAPGSGCLVLFALPFVAVGVGMTILLAVKLLEHHKMRSWVPVPARILSADLESQDSDDGTTYRAVASYEYEFGGQTYRGDRVGLHGGSDNVGKFQRRAADELGRHRRTGKPVIARVDPQSPGDAILYTDLRLGMVAMYAAFGLTFGSAGLGLLVSGLLAGREQRAENARRLAAPDVPWHWGAGWKEGRIPQLSGKAKRAVLVVLAVFWNGLGFALLAATWEQVFATGNWLGLLFLLVPAIGFLIAWMALRALVRQRKFGTSIFEMAAVPGVAGGKLAGAIVTDRHLDAQGGFVQRLICEETVTRQTSDGSSTSVEAVWDDERVLTGELWAEDRTRSAVPVLFAIPYGTPPTSSDGRQIKWKLRMDAAVPGVDYHAEFEVPVFVTAESSPDFVLDESPIAHLSLPGGLEERLRRAGAKVQDAGQGLEIAFPLLLHRGAIGGLAVFTLLWIGVTVLVAKLGAPLLFPVVFGLFGALLLLLLASMIFTNKQLVLAPLELVSSGGLFGREKRIPYRSLARASLHCGMRTGNRSYFSVRVTDKQGRSATLTPDLRPTSTAQALLDEIERRMADGG